MDKNEYHILKGLFIDTCDNRTSVISKEQYDVCCQQFTDAETFQKASSGPVNGIGVIINGIGTATIAVPFKDQGIVIKVEFLILKENILTPLNMKYILQNGLGIFIQERCVTCGTRKKKLVWENPLLRNNWNVLHMAFVIYTESELGALHPNFGHPSVPAL